MTTITQMLNEFLDRSYALFIYTLFTLAFTTGCTSPPPAPVIPEIVSQSSGSDALFIGISIVNDQTVWISGTAGSYGKTTDGGQISQGVEMLLQNDGGEWRLKQLRLLPEDEARHDGLL